MDTTLAPSSRTPSRTPVESVAQSGGAQQRRTLPRTPRQTSKKNSGKTLIGRAVEVKFDRKWYHGEVVDYAKRPSDSGDSPEKSPASPRSTSSSLASPHEPGFGYHIQYEDGTDEWIRSVSGDSDVRLIHGVTYKEKVAYERKGIKWDSVSRSWKARISVRGRSILIGTFSGVPDAVAAQKIALADVQDPAHVGRASRNAARRGDGGESFASPYDMDTSTLPGGERGGDGKRLARKRKGPSGASEQLSSRFGSRQSSAEDPVHEASIATTRPPKKKKHLAVDVGEARGTLTQGPLSSPTKRRVGRPKREQDKAAATSAAERRQKRADDAFAKKQRELFKQVETSERRRQRTADAFARRQRELFKQFEQKKKHKQSTATRSGNVDSDSGSDEDSDSQKRVRSPIAARKAMQEAAAAAKTSAVASSPRQVKKERDHAVQSGKKKKQTTRHPEKKEKQEADSQPHGRPEHISKVQTENTEITAPPPKQKSAAVKSEDRSKLAKDVPEHSNHRLEPKANKKPTSTLAEEDGDDDDDDGTDDDDRPRRRGRKSKRLAHEAEEAAFVDPVKVLTGREDGATLNASQEQFLEKQRQMYERFQKKTAEAAAARQAAKQARRAERAAREKAAAAAVANATTKVKPGAADSAKPISRKRPAPDEEPEGAGEPGVLKMTSKEKRDKVKKAKKKKKKREREQRDREREKLRGPVAQPNDRRRNGAENQRVPRQLVVVAPFMKPLGRLAANRRGPAAALVERLNLDSVCNLLPHYFPLKKRLRYLDDLQRGGEAAVAAAAEAMQAQASNQRIQ